MSDLSVLQHVCFDLEIDPQADLLLQQGVERYRAGKVRDAELCFHRAIFYHPHELSIYQALYKLLVTERRLDEALDTVQKALNVAASKGSFAADWTQLGRDSVDWDDMGAPRFFLYSLKAYAFIQLRRGNADEAKQALNKLLELDNEDRVGGSVVRDLCQHG